MPNRIAPSRPAVSTSRGSSATFPQELQKLKGAMRPGFTADLQQAMDKLFGAMSQDTATVRDYGVLRNLMNEALTRHGANLSPKEKKALESARDVFAQKSETWSFAGDWKAFAGVTPSFPSLQTKAADAPVGAYARSSDPRATATLTGPSSMTIKVTADPTFRESTVRVTVGRGQALVNVKKGMTAQQVADEIRRQLVAADPSLRISTSAAPGADLGAQQWSLAFGRR